MLLYFGALGSHPTDRVRAAETALAVRQIVAQVPAPTVDGQMISISCRIGIAQGAVFAGEIGEPRGRREFNLLGDPVNTAARLMSRAAPNQILLSEDVQQAIAPHFHCQAIGNLTLKGKAAAMAVFELVGAT
jgi:class 3 adenylate cyclase